MADKEIGVLTAATTPLAGTETVHTVQSGNSRKVTAENLYRWAAPRGHIHGLALSNNSTDATNDIDVAVGDAASDDTNAILIRLTSAITKRLDAAWAVGTGNGGLDTGTVANTTYYVWLVRRSDTGVVDVLFSASNSSPTMPTNYDQKRLIGSFARVVGANTSPRSFGDGRVTDWVAYTPTLTGFGTASSVVFFSRMVGDTLEVRGKFTSGTPTATEARVELGFNGTSGNVVIDSVKNPSRLMCGVGVTSATGAFQITPLADGAIGYLTLGVQQAATSGLTPLNGNSIAVATDVISFIASVPITGW